jgi:hypothetical protein
VVYIVGIVIIIFSLLALLGGGCFLFLKYTGKTTDKMDFFNVLTITIIISIIYIVNAVYLLRLRSWAREFLLWFIPLSVIFDISISGVDLLGATDAIDYVVRMIIWIILLNKNIKDVFDKVDLNTRAGTG